ncbi:MAG: hypothetical protein LBB86_04170 [Oscillospiraceae bacterium]|jgi:hypothetical protein|nr:hypothetical protein [Oscillospiraceae bacterium]
MTRVGGVDRVVIGMGGLVGLEQISGFSELISLFFAAMMGWAHSLSNWVWSMISGSGKRGGSWLTSNWIQLLVVLIIIGVALDWLMWMLRWQPYKLWFKSLRQRARRADPQYADSAEPTQYIDAVDIPLDNDNASLEYESEYPVELTADYSLEDAAEQPFGAVLEQSFDVIPEQLLDLIPEQSFDIIPEQPLDLIPEQPLDIIPEQLQPLGAMPASDIMPALETADEPIYEPVYETVYESIPDAIVPEPAPRRSWRNSLIESVRTVTGKPARRRGLLRLTGDDDEAIPGLPPMMSHDEGYYDPTLPPEQSFQTQRQDAPNADSAGIEL